MPTSIDRLGRIALIKALKAYAAKRISNDELDAETLGATEDAGLNAVRDAAWTLYSDLDTHFADGKHALTLSTKREVARWILFLRSEAEYLYPKRSPISLALATHFDSLLSFLTFGAFGRWLRRRQLAFANAGDVSVWPFASRQQLRGALSLRRSPLYD